MPVDRKLLEILVCPITKQPVFPVEPETVKKLNQRIAEGSIVSLDGKPVELPVEEALITRNKTTIYRVEDGIPVMLEDQGIATDQLE